MIKSKCNYKYEDETEKEHFECQEEALPGSNYCILHTEFPEDENSDEFKSLSEKKNERIDEKVKKKDFNFFGAILPEIDFSYKKIDRFVNFRHAIIKGDVSFTGAEVDGIISFRHAVICGAAYFAAEDPEVDFYDATIKKDTWFMNTKIKGAEFRKATFEGDVAFTNATMCQDAYFHKATFKKSAHFHNVTIENFGYFHDATFEGYAHFDGAVITKVDFLKATFEGDSFFYNATIDGWANFQNTTFEGDANFDGSTLKKPNFETTTFKVPSGQESACRVAKNAYEALGDRSKADKYFYLEMEAKRKQKSNWKSKLEYIFMQKAFGYGIYPTRVIALWLLFIFGFGLIYLILGSLGIYFGFKVIDGIDGSLWQVPDYFYFSVFTATGFDFVHYNLKPEFQILASIEVIFGIFIWAAFLVIFARKYMR